LEKLGKIPKNKGIDFSSTPLAHDLSPAGHAESGD
jgi:hypothetical protein